MSDPTRLSLAGQTAIVTGAANGIGRGIALRLAEAGADVAIVDVDEPAAVATVADIQKLGRKSRFIRADLTSAQDAKAAVKAIDAVTGTVKWEYPVSRGSLAAGVLATGGGVLFSSTREGAVIALDAKTGKLLWNMQTGGTISSSPISYAVDGKQYVAVSAGAVLYSFALPE